MDAFCSGACPAWLPGETFFSLCSRLHLMSGHQRPASTAEELFNLTERSIKHDFPCGLDAFERITAGRWGTAIPIIEHHTIFPFFSPFQSASAVKGALAQIRSSSLGPLKYRLGLVCGGFGADHPLRACSSCMNRDMASNGVSYWHLCHQYPGVVVCPEHGEVLYECIQNRRWCGRFTWTMPCTGTLRDSDYGVITSVEQKRLVQLASACRDLGSIGLAKHLDPVVVAQLYRKWLPAENSAQSLLAHIGALRRFRPYGDLPSTESATTSFISQMVRSPRRHIHPLKHLMMITWLFGEVSSFVECHDVACAQHNALSAQPALAPMPEVPVSPASIKGHPRPKRLKPEIRAVLLSRLAAGTAKDEICREFQLTISTVNKLLRAEPDVQASWAARRMTLDQADHRLRWAELQARFPSHSLTELRRKCQALYAWLHRNDRDWLSSQVSEMAKPDRAHNPRVDWNSRDKGLRRELEAEIIRRFGSDQNLGLKQSQIFTILPRLAQRLERRDRYPQTRAYMKLLSKR
ncbi:TnsD family Tn7-like transposition protein [Pseudomonas putida]|uniref:TnsD family Tn7-like transposition protein n=1 Tax=Pseudomonas putida TaxID=303 RepID=UPI002B246378|nr:TnsD family Tn7-like transposition protein [Pseudomonas putida]